MASARHGLPVPSQGVGAGRDGDAIVGALAGDTVAQDRAGVLPQAEHGAQVAPEAGQQQQGGFEILDQRVHASRSPSPYLGKPAGIVKSFQKNISGSCNPLQAKDVWAGYENLTIRHPHLMLLPPGLAPLRVPA